MAIGSYSNYANDTLCSVDLRKQAMEVEAIVERGIEVSGGCYAEHPGR